MANHYAPSEALRNYRKPNWSVTRKKNCQSVATLLLNNTVPQSAGVFLRKFTGKNYKCSYLWTLFFYSVLIPTVNSIKHLEILLHLFCFRLHYYHLKSECSHEWHRYNQAMINNITLIFQLKIQCLSTIE